MNLEASAKTIDPVCKMEVIPFQSAGKSEHEGHIYYFCTPACKQLFEQVVGQFEFSHPTPCNFATEFMAPGLN